MNKTHFRLIALCLIASLSLACSVSNMVGDAVGDAVSNAVDSADLPLNDLLSEDGDGPADDATTGSAGSERIDLDDPSIYSEITGSDYSVVMDFNFTAENADGSVLYRAIVLTGMRNNDPPESYFRMDPNDPAVMDGIDYMEIADIGGTDYIYSPEIGCSVFAQDEFNNPYDTLLDTGGILTGEAVLISEGETVNGVRVDVYEVTEVNIDPSDPGASDFIELTEGLVYLARDEGKVVRVRLAGRGISELLSGSTTLEGDIVYQVDFIPSDTPFEIAPPEACDTTGSDGGLPIMADATGVSSFPGLLSYSSPSSVDDVLAFYKAEMAALGYSVTGEFDQGGLNAIDFSDGSSTVSLQVLTDGQGLTTVLVISEP